MFGLGKQPDEDYEDPDEEVAQFREAVKKNRRRRATPTILQMEATECGAACLGMILSSYGRNVPLERLRYECGVSRDGSKASHVLKAARAYGMEAKGYKRDLPKLVDIGLPCIVFWNFNHFVVLEGFKGDKVYINDPAEGPRTLTVDEFDQGYTGVVLEMSPGETFEKGGRKTNHLWKLLRRLETSKAGLTFVMLATLGLVIPGLVVPIFSKIFVDEILIRQLDGWIMPLLIGMAVTAIIKGGLTWLQQAYLARLDSKIAITQASSFFWHVLKLPIGFFNQRFAGDISSRVAANDRVAQLLSGSLATNMANIPTVVFYFAVMVAFDWLLALVGAAMALINVVALRVMNRVREDGSRRMLQDQGKLSGTSVAGIQMMETLKSSGQEDDFFSKWAGYQAKYLNSRQEFSFYSTILNSVPTLISSLITAVILGVGGLRVIDGALTVGSLVAFQSLMRSFTGPIEGMVSFAGSMQEIKGDLARLDDVLNHEVDPRLAESEDQKPAMQVQGAGTGAAAATTPPPPSDSDVSVDPEPKLRGHIELRDLTFGYTWTAAPLVQDLNLTIHPGQRVALIGGSGSGKSTVAKLMGGLHQPWSGDILFDGRSLMSIPQDTFAQSVASVDQEIFLFEGTLRDNVSMWDETVTETDITAALRDAAVLDVIESRPGRYDARVAEMGANFSGGQRQRIEIARALVNNPSILILDEATAALDPVVEKEIDDNIRRRGCTTVVVAHRLSTVRDADEIIVLDKGRVAQRGIHEDLIEQDGPYRNLMQAE